MADYYVMVKGTVQLTAKISVNGTLEQALVQAKSMSATELLEDIYDDSESNLEITGIYG